MKGRRGALAGRTANCANGFHPQMQVALHSLPPDRKGLHVLQCIHIGAVLGVVVAAHYLIAGCLVPLGTKICEGNDHVAVFADGSVEIGLVAVGVTALRQVHVAEADAIPGVFLCRCEIHLEGGAGRQVGVWARASSPRQHLDESGRVQKWHNGDLSIEFRNAVLDGDGAGRLPAHDGIVHGRPNVDGVVEVFDDDLVILRCGCE
mmetsp:Transcript_24407/g.52291  ORF Transcript_24407/g.52291 Transcript_24407/m.52291 type:complete len:205 (-) Transcript_24407:194-808(-)